MFNFFKKSKSSELPYYSFLKSKNLPSIPDALREMEMSESHTLYRDEIEKNLLSPPECPLDTTPILSEVLFNDGLLLITIEEGKQCALVFTSPIKATDYVNFCKFPKRSIQYISSNAKEFMSMLKDLQNMNIESFTVDFCPRCGISTIIKCNSIKAPLDGITIWGIHKATEIARNNLYLEYAQQQALSGKWVEARDVAFEIIAHVTLEDLRTHLLIGQIALAEGNKKLLSEAKSFLHFFQNIEFQKKMEEIEKSGKYDFSFPN